MGLEQEYAIVDPRPPPVIRLVEIAEVYSVIQVNIMHVLICERIVDQDVIVGRNEKNIPEFVVVIEGRDKPAMQRRTVLKP